MEIKYHIYFSVCIDYHQYDLRPMDVRFDFEAVMIFVVVVVVVVAVSFLNEITFKFASPLFCLFQTIKFYPRKQSLFLLSINSTNPNVGCAVGAVAQIIASMPIFQIMLQSASAVYRQKCFSGDFPSIFPLFLCTNCSSVKMLVCSHVVAVFVIRFCGY